MKAPLAALRRETETAAHARPFRWLVAAGFLARGVTYGVIGGLTLAIAVGAGTMGVAPNQEGALALIARTVPGRIALIAVCAGLLAYSGWKLTQGVFGRGPEGGGGSHLQDRLANLGGAAVYLVFFAVAVRVMIGSPGNSSSEPRHVAAGILGWPGGRLIVGVAGCALATISLYQLYDALRGRFAKDSKVEQMGARERRLFMGLGHIGLTARALVFAVVGYFLLRTAINFNPADAVGVDGVLARLHNEPLGPWILGVIAAGLLVFTAFSFLEARYRRL